MRHSAIHPSERPQLDITGTPSELAVLDLLQRFDCLPSHYIKAWFSNNHFIRGLLTRLSKGHYIGLLPGDDAWLFARQKNRHYPLAIYPRGEALLAKRGLWIDRTKGNDHFDHKFLRSLIMFSFALGAKEYGLTLRTFEEILADPRCPKREKPHRLPVKGRTIIPDEIFGLTNGSKYIFFHLEADNSTEVLISKQDRETIEGKINDYDHYLKAQGFKDCFGLNNLTVLFVTTSQKRADNILELIRKTPTAARFAVKAVTDFNELYPPATGYMVSEPWRRTTTDLNLVELLHGERQSGENLRASKDNQSSGSGVREADGRRAA